MNQFNSVQGGEDYLLTLYEVCEILGKSTRTITRYVHRHILHPRGVKSRQGTLEYRFSRAEIDEFKKRQDSIRPYVYITDRTAPEPAVSAKFADYQYGSPAAQTPFLIPGISFSTQAPVSAPRVLDGSQDVKPGAESRPIFETARPKEEKNDTEKETKNLKAVLPKEAENAMAQKRNDDEIISLLKETTGMLRDQLKVKDDQIKNLDDKVGQLIERNRETNILLKGLQDKIMLLEKPKDENNDRVQRSGSDAAGCSEIQFNERQQPEILPKEEKNSQTPVRLKILSNATESGVSDKGARFDSSNSGTSNSVAPRPNLPRGESSEKKGLFGRLFK